jgi:hypothetical protein
MKRKLLGGNYDLEKNPEVNITQKKDVSDFEKDAIEHLGGSIAFVRGGSLYDENNE